MFAQCAMQKTRYCWDSCVFIAILTAEDRTEDERTALNDAVNAVDRGHAIMVTSTLVQAEVLDAIKDPSVSGRFRDVLNLPNVLQQSVTSAIARRAGELRQALRGKVKLSTADAVFVATALVHKCDSLQTYDAILLSLTGRPEVSGLRVTKPTADQTSLELAQ